MQKKLWAVLITFTMVISTMLTGCGAEKNKVSVSSDSKESSVDSEKSSEQSTASSESEELAPVTLKFWVSGSETEDSGMVQDAVNEYLKDVLPNTTVEIERIASSEYGERWSKAMASREEIDLAWFGWMLNQEAEVKMGSLMPLDDLIAEYGQGIVDTVSQESLDLHRASDGNLYFCVSWQGLVSGHDCFILPADNVALMGDGWLEEFQAALYESCDDICFYDDTAQMKTLSMLEDYLKASKDAGLIGQGIGFGTNKTVDMIIRPGQEKKGIGSCAEAILVGDTYEVYKLNSFNSPAAKVAAINHDFYEKGYIRQDIASVGFEATDYSKLPNTYITMSVRGLVDSAVTVQETASGKDLEMVYNSKDAYRAPGFSSGTVIPSTSKNPERAMMFLNLLYSDAELYRLLVHGIEGTHYVKNGDGTITLQDTPTYKGVNNWVIGSCVNSYATNPDLLKQYQDLHDLEVASEVSAFAGFAFDNSNVSVEMSNLNAINKEYEMVFTYDNFEEAYQKYIDAMDAAGADKVFEEVVKQLEAYAAKKGRKVKVVDLDAL